jgi:hypothetical protein
MESAQRYLDAEATPMHRANFRDVRKKSDLARYHFVATLGVTMRHLVRGQLFFPGLKPAYLQAQHLRQEAKLLRDMIEHSDEYADGNGRHQSKFVRSGAPQPGFTADATSTVIDNNGHWLGGRLNVERAMAELRVIFDELEKVPIPA